MLEDVLKAMKDSGKVMYLEVSTMFNGIYACALFVLAHAAGIPRMDDLLNCYIDIVFQYHIIKPSIIL